MDQANQFFDLLKEMCHKHFNKYVQISKNEISLTLMDSLFKSKEEEEIIYTLNRNDVISGFSEVENSYPKGETSLLLPYYYETLINTTNNEPRTVYSFNRKFIFRKFSFKEKVDKYNGLKYVISPISKKFLYKLFTELNVNEKEYFLNSLVERSSRSLPNRYLGEREKEIAPDLLNILIDTNSKLLSLKIESEECLKIRKYNQLSDAFIFNISYNLDFSITKYTNISDLILRKRFSVGRKTEYDEIDTPKKIYIPDLIYHYENALSTDNPHLQFISYYHIIEYFYNDVYNRHLINTVKQKITEPSFSSVKTESINNLIRLIQKNLKKNGEEHEYNEKESLRLTLKEYVKLNQLIDGLNEYNSKSLKHYSEPVSFLGKYSIEFGPTEDEITENNKKIYSQIAERIYGVRNSVVHSKKGDKAICLPVKHDRDLLLEIPLVRLVAEQIIINSSEFLKFDDT